MARAVYIGLAAFFFACLLAAVLLQQMALLALPFAALFVAVTRFHLFSAWLCLLFCLPLSAETGLGEMLSTDLPDEPMMLLLSVAFLALWAAGSTGKATGLVRHPVFILIVLQWLWAASCICFSTHALISLKYVLAKTWYILPFTVMPFFLLKEEKALRYMIAALLVPLAVTVLFILYKQAAGGFRFDDVNHVVKPFFRNHVNYGAMLVCAIPVLYFAARGSTHKNLRRLLYALLPVFMAALFFSYSRGAWLAALVGLLAAVCIRLKILPAMFVLCLTALVVTACWFAKDNRYLFYHHNYKKTIYHQYLADHMQATFRNTDLSNAERIYRWIAAVRMSGERPVTGFGPGTFYNNYPPYGVSYFKTWVSNNPEHSTVHNYFLLLLTEQGIPGLLLFVLLLLILFSRVQTLYHRFTNGFYRTVALCTGMVLAMIVTVNMLSDLVETDKIGSLFYLCCGVVIVLEAALRQPVKNS